MDPIKVSVLGLRGHAGQHIDFLKQNPAVVLEKVYYYRVPPSDCVGLPMTGTLSDCLSSDVIIVSTPTSSHAEYMSALVEFDGYILLEKPAVNTKDQIRELQRLPESLKSRVRVNFNFQFHEFRALLFELIRGGQLGKVFAFDVHTSHGVAFRQDWDNTWRVDNETGLGPLETTGIHYIQFALTEFGECAERNVYTGCLSGRPQAIDTGIIYMTMEDSTWVRIRHSYAAPYAIRFEVWGTEGYVVYDGRTATLHSPRDTFDSSGRYADPPISGTWEIEFQKAWIQSLVKAQSAFLDIARGGILLDPSVFDRDVSAMSVLVGSHNDASARI